MITIQDSNNLNDEKKNTSQIVGGRPGNQWFRYDERQVQACWRKNDRNKKTPFLSVNCLNSFVLPPSPFF